MVWGSGVLENVDKGSAIVGLVGGWSEWEVFRRRVRRDLRECKALVPGINRDGGRRYFQQLLSRRDKARSERCRVHLAHRHERNERFGTNETLRKRAAASEPDPRQRGPNRKLLGEWRAWSIIRGFSKGILSLSNGGI